MSPNEFARFFVSMFVFGSIATAIILRGPIGRAIARRIEGKLPDTDGLASRVAELEQRLADVEQERHRVAELEERLDFAERLLASPQTPDRGSR